MFRITCLSKRFLNKNIMITLEKIKELTHSEFLKALIEEFHGNGIFEIKEIVDESFKRDFECNEQEGQIFQTIWLNQAKTGDDSYSGYCYIQLNDIEYLKVWYSC